MYHREVKSARWQLQLAMIQWWTKVPARLERLWNYYWGQVSSDFVEIIWLPSGSLVSAYLCMYLYIPPYVVLGIPPKPCSGSRLSFAHPAMVTKLRTNHNTPMREISYLTVLANTLSHRWPRPDPIKESQTSCCPIPISISGALRFQVLRSCLSWFMVGSVFVMKHFTIMMMALFREVGIKKKKTSLS